MAGFPIPEVLNLIRGLDRLARWLRSILVYCAAVLLSIGLLYQVSKVLQPSSNFGWVLAPITGTLVAFATAQSAVKFSFYLWEGTENAVQEIISRYPDRLDSSLFTHVVSVGITLILIFSWACLCPN